MTDEEAIAHLRQQLSGASAATEEARAASEQDQGVALTGRGLTTISRALNPFYLRNPPAAERQPFWDEYAEAGEERLRGYREKEKALQDMLSQRERLALEREKVEKPPAPKIVNVPVPKAPDPLLEQKRASMEAETERTRAQTEKLKRPTPKAPKPDKSKAADVKQSNILRREFTNLPEVKAFRAVETSNAKVQSLAADATGASDLALIYAFMRGLDDSVVKEGEFANASMVGGLRERAANRIEQVKSGQRLTPEQRREFAATSSRLLAAQKQTHDAAVERYSYLADRYAIDPGEVVPVQAPKPKTGGGLTPEKQKRLEELRAIRDREAAGKK